MKLEVGKKYLNRKNEIIEIIRKDNHEVFPFDCSDENSYMENGRRYNNFEESDYDLISEYIEKPIRGNGDSTSYYDLPEGATQLKDLIKHKKMEHGIGEAFCALYRLNDNGEYKRNLTKAKFYIEEELKWLEKNA